MEEKRYKFFEFGEGLRKEALEEIEHTDKKVVVVVVVAVGLEHIEADLIGE